VAAIGSKRNDTMASNAPSLGLAAFALALLDGACGSPPTSPRPAESTPASSSPAGISSSSYANFKEIGLVPQKLPPGWNCTRAYGNFTGGGPFDLFRAIATYEPTRPIDQATPSRFEFYTKQPNGSYVLNTTVMPQTDGCIHPRKAIVADFNNDGRPDVFVACHGYDAPPYPGERNKVVLSQANGTYSVSDASPDSGFNHGASAADLDGDGYVDVVVADVNTPARGYVLLNDRTGHFRRELAPRLPPAIRGGNYFSVELVDVDMDGRLDLIMGGHEWQRAPTVVFINPGSNNFSSATPVVIPGVPGNGVVLDFSLTGAGSARTLWFLRTSGGDGTFYEGRVLQRVDYASLASTVVLNQRPAQPSSGDSRPSWVPWAVPCTVNGVAMIASDDAADELAVVQ
jgi:FG-GAP-like repeat